MRLPFWNKISENGKQFLAIIAIAQAIHFIIAVPLGIYDGWKWRKNFEGNVWMVSRSMAAENAILSELWRNANGPIWNYAYREVCLEWTNERASFIYNPPTQYDCNKIKTLPEIVQGWVSTYEVPDDEIEGLLLSLALSGLPVSVDSYGLLEN